MAEDTLEKNLPITNDCGWIRALDANGNSIRISKSDLVDLILLNLPNVSLTSGGIVSSTQFKDIFYSHPDNTYDFNNAYLQSGIYGINKDSDFAGINVPPESPRYGIMIHFRAFQSSALGGNPALQLYFSSMDSPSYFRIYWLGKWSSMKLL